MQNSNAFNGTFNPFIQFFHFEQNYQLGVLFDPSGCSPDRQTHAMVVPDFNLDELDENGEPQYPPYVSVCAKNFTEATIGQYKIFECDLFLIAQHHEYILGKYQERQQGKLKGLFAKMVKFDKTLGEFEQEVNQVLAQKMAQAWAEYTYHKKMPVGNIGNIGNIANVGSSAYRQQTNASSNSKNIFWLAVLIPALLVGLLWAFQGFGFGHKQGLDMNMSDPNSLIQQTNNTLKQMGLEPSAAANTNCLTDNSATSAAIQNLEPVEDTSGTLPQ